MIEPANDGTLRYVLNNLRARDAQEAYAVLWGDTPEDIHHRVTQSRGAAFIAHTKSEPAAVFGYAEIRPSVCSVYMLATDRWPEVALGVTRFIKRALIPHLVKTGVHRAECQSLADYETAHRWLVSLGAHQEGSVLENYGKNGEDFLTFVWLAENRVLLSDKTRQN